MPLHGNDIDGVDACGTWRPSRLGRRHRIGPARETRQRVVAGGVGGGRASCGTSQGHRRTCQSDTGRACRRALADSARYAYDWRWGWCRRCDWQAVEDGDVVEAPAVASGTAVRTHAPAGLHRLSGNVRSEIGDGVDATTG